MSISTSPWTAECQASLSFTLSWSLLQVMSIDLVRPSNCLILCCPLLLLPSVFPRIRVFFSELALHIKWPKYWSLSFSISPSNGYSGLISLELTGLDLIFLLSNRLSRIFFSTTVWKHHFFSLLCGPALTSIHSYWKKQKQKHSFDYTYICWQSDVS